MTREQSELQMTLCVRGRFACSWSWISLIAINRCSIYAAQEADLTPAVKAARYQSQLIMMRLRLPMQSSCNRNVIAIDREAHSICEWKSVEKLQLEQLCGNRWKTRRTKKSGGEGKSRAPQEYCTVWTS